MVRWICLLVIHLHFWEESSKNVHANDTVKQRFDDIIVPSQDNRQYRGLELKNGMRVMLISDPETEKSAASLLVGVGALEDPADLPGLTNMVGHMIFQTAKSQFRKFENFVENHQGKIDEPFTGEDVQCFAFEIASPYFTNALDKFAKFFVDSYIHKGFKPVAVARALELIENNFIKQKLGDIPRISQVEKSMSKPNHPYTQSSQGNMSTLCPQARISAVGIFILPDGGVNFLYNAVRLFHAVWYSSDLMTLVVLGRENLDILEETVTSLFHQVKRKSTPIGNRPFAYENHPWGAEQLKNKIYVVPLDVNYQNISLSFPMPDYNANPDQYFAAADIYVEHCISHQGRGTLFSVLQSRELCNHLDFHYDSLAGIALARIICDITDRGLRQIDTIINLIFQYIHLLNEDGPHEWLFNEMRISFEKSFLHSRTSEDLFEYVRAISSQLQYKNFPMENILSRSYTRHTWRPEIIREFLSYFRPENMNVTIVSKSVAEMAELSKEEHFGTEYKIERISETLIQKWSSKNESINDLQLPLPNEFISENLFLYPLDDESPRQPYVIHKSPIFEIWFKQEELSIHPEMHIIFEFFSSIAHVGAVENTLWRLFFNLLSVSLNDTLYAPEISGVRWADWSLEMSEPGIHVKLLGFGDKVPLLLEKVLSIITNFENDLDENSFNTAKKRFVRDAKRDASTDHIFQGKWYLQHSCVDGTLNIDDILSIMPMLEVFDMKRFLRKLFQRMFIRAFIYGNCNKKRALEVVEIFKKPFPSSKGLLLVEMLRPRFMEILDGSHDIYQVPDRNRGGYSYIAYFQIGVDFEDYMNHVKSLLLYTLIQDSCRDFLMPVDAETNNDEFQNVRCSLFQTYGVQGFVITIRSKKDPRYIHKRVDQYLKHIPALLHNFKMNNAYQAVKDNVERYLTPTDLIGQCDNYWGEISNRSYNFDGIETRAINLMRNLTLKDLTEFAKAGLDPSSPRRRILAVHVFPRDVKQTKAKLTKFILPKAKKIEDVIVFKSQSTWLPHNIIELPPTHLEVNSDQEKSY